MPQKNKELMIDAVKLNKFLQGPPVRTHACLAILLQGIYRLSLDALAADAIAVRRHPLPEAFTSLVIEK